MSKQRWVSTARVVLVCAVLELAATGVASASGSGELLATPSPPPTPSLPAQIASALAPPIPNQPGIPAAPCTTPPIAAGQFQALSFTFSGTPSAAVVDPATPCRLYRATDRQTVERSVDLGRTWVRVFHDDATVAMPSGGSCHAPGCAPAFGATSMSLLGDERGPLLTEGGNGDAIVAGRDAGTSWQLLDGGLQGRRVAFVVSAPGNAGTFYAVTEAASVPVWQSTLSPPTGSNGQAAQMYATSDGGATWTLTTLPLPAQIPPSAVSSLISDDIRVDPANPLHLWAALPLRPPADQTAGLVVDREQWDLFESTDGARHWVDRAKLPAPLSGPITQLEVVSSPRHPTRLVMSGPFADLGSDVVLSDDGGASWFASPLIAQTAARIGVSPHHRNVVAIATSDGRQSRPLHVYTSLDGIDSLTAATPPDWLPSCSLASSNCALQGDGVNPACCDDLPHVAAVQLDDLGSAYLTVRYQCGSLAKAVPPACPDTRGGFRYVLTRYGIPTTSGSQHSWAPIPTSTAAAPQALTELTSCPVPARVSVTDPQNGGALAFDGHELLYTNPHEGTATTSVIHTLDPARVGCPSRDDIQVSFSADDLARWSRANGVPSGSALWVDDLTYDQRRNVIWATLGGPNSVGLFAISVTRDASGHRLGSAALAFLNGCGLALSYEWQRDRLWTCDDSVQTTNTVGVPSLLSASTGLPVSSCAAKIGGDVAQGGVASANSGMATWTVISPDRLYKQLEDDATVEAYDTVSCQLVARYVHRTFSEPSQEDEQMACDSLTFAPGAASVASGTPSGAVVWMRDANASLISSFVAPEGACAEPTDTTYQGPPAAAVGTPVQLCASLEQLYPGGSTPLARLPLTLTIDGLVTRAVALPATATDGRACAQWTADVPPGEYHVVARFSPSLANPDRSGQYLGSAASGVLLVTGSVLQAGGSSDPHGGGPLFAGGLPPSGGPAETSQSIGQSPSAAEIQAQAQTQSQAQGQSQSVAQLQPGLMAQRQRRTQVAVQQQSSATQTSYQASALRRGNRPGAAVAAAFLMLGFGVLMRRPRWSMARSTRRRPPQG